MRNSTAHEIHEHTANGCVDTPCCLTTFSFFRYLLFYYLHNYEDAMGKHDEYDVPCWRASWFKF